jgi:tetratricopeptide (TPR) repeat protein
MRTRAEQLRLLEDVSVPDQPKRVEAIIARLSLTPLPVEEIDRACDLRSAYEPFRSPDPYAPLWRKLTAKRRPSYEMDRIAWGAFPDADIEANPTCDAAELAESGDIEGARELLMDVVMKELRCIDAHAHLGNLEFDNSPQQATAHYEVGIGIGELSLPLNFDGVLLWGLMYNRPFLRSLHGYGLCLWRLGRTTEAQTIFERILSLNPNDNQGVRFCWEDLRKGRTWQFPPIIRALRGDSAANGVPSSASDFPHVSGRRFVLTECELLNGRQQRSILPLPQYCPPCK